jgi:hypothetical protein
MLAQSGSRNRYYLQPDEETDAWSVAYEAGNNAANHATYYLQLAEGELQVIQGIVFDAMANENDPWFMAYDLDWDVSNDTPIDEDTANSVMNTGRNTYAAQAYFPYSLYKRVQVPLRKRACRPLQSEKRGFGFPFPVDKSDPFLFGTAAQIRSSKLTLFYSNCCIFKYV